MDQEYSRTAQKALRAACRHSDVNGAREALNAGALATGAPRLWNGKDVKSPLQLVASSPSKPEGPALIRLLVDRGADPNAYICWERRINYKGSKCANALPLVSARSPHNDYVNDSLFIRSTRS
jgi:hypothetical protein